MTAQIRAKEAIHALGRGYDVVNDLRLSHCKENLGACLIELDESHTQDLIIPGGITVHGVPKSITCEKGERTRFKSDVLPFQQMSEQVNQWMSISGKIPLGLFNGMFGFSGHWQKDAASVKDLVIDGWLITLYSVELPKSQLILREEIKKDVPSSWDSSALASFIEKYGTHIVVGVKIGGKDVLCVKQHHSSEVSAVEIQALLKRKADERFGKREFDSMISSEQKSDIEQRTCKSSEFSSKWWPAVVLHDYIWRGCNLLLNHSNQYQFYGATTTIYSSQEDATVLYNRRGGSDTGQSHDKWLQTVPGSPDAILMSLVPITSLLNGVSGSGFLSHAVNLYLRHKPPIEELMQFLEFQLPRQWAPIFSELPLGPPRKEHGTSSLQFSLIGPKLHVNTTPVNVGKRPVTGLRLYLEGRKCNRLAIHIQHLSAAPRVLQPLWEDTEPRWQHGPGNGELDQRYLEPVSWRNFSHVCTAPVEKSEGWTSEGEDPCAYAVVGARLGVKGVGMKNVLFLDLLYSKILDAKIRRSEWDHTPTSSQRSGFFSTLMSGTFANVQRAALVRPPLVNLNSGIFPGGPPNPSRVPKLLKFVDTTELTKGPQDMPGHWLITGARLYLERGKISLRAKYSLLIY